MCETHRLGGSVRNSDTRIPLLGELTFAMPSMSIRSQCRRRVNSVTQRKNDFERQARLRYANRA